MKNNNDSSISNYKKMKNSFILNEEFDIVS